MTTTPQAAAQAEPQEVDQWKFSSDQYHWLIEAGILTTDHRVELIEGMILTMPPKGDKHGDAIRDLNLWLCNRRGEDYVPSCQVTLRLAEGFTPDPDFTLLRYRAAGYRGDNRPTAADVLLVIEVADSSLARDLGPKSLAYARAGVPELWVVDLPHRQIHRLTRHPPRATRSRPSSGRMRPSARC